MKIAVIGLGPVGLSNAILLARQNTVTAYDPCAVTVAELAAGRSPVDDSECREYLASGMLDLRATTEIATALTGAELVILAPQIEAGQDALAVLEPLIRAAQDHCPRANLIMRTALPVGTTRQLREATGYAALYPMPQRLRAGQALRDGLYPEVLVIGDRGRAGKELARLFRCAALSWDVPTQLTDPDEAEATTTFQHAEVAIDAIGHPAKARSVSAAALAETRSARSHQATRRAQV